ncbi:cyclophilin-like fold protein [Treponema sp. C6A8]|uniref:cyclophilin-like fold protein n=1 Tax=Treponema sp. C6A8 TaxID=1410609 RepID=UPI000A8999C8|nr:cyclophilin-like fold protein [Treponema sp. C6A8]
MRKLISYILTILLFTSIACANGSKETKASNKGELSDMKISIQITSDSGSHTLAATLADNSSAMAFYELLEKGPVTIKMTDYGSFEKVGSLGTSLPRNDKQITTAAGDIILYQGNQITIYYDTNSWNFTRLGKVDGVTQAELKKILGKGDVTAVFEILR